MEHPDLFDESGFTQFCGYAQAIHPNVPVIRVNFEMNVRDNSEWWQSRRQKVLQVGRIPYRNAVHPSR